MALEVILVSVIAVLLYLIVVKYPQFADFLIVVLLSFNLYFLLKGTGLIHELASVRKVTPIGRRE